MLEIICASSLTLSIRLCQSPGAMYLPTTNHVLSENITEQNIISKPVYLANGKPHDSKYRRAADRELDELRGDRDYRDRDYDRYRRDRDYNRGRTYREPQRREREINIEYDDDRDRYDNSRSLWDYLRRRR
ncbi:MAG: hypothetical protein AAF383_15605 [Cyanobacteria bacterium P01_A01_bin.83]